MALNYFKMKNDELTDRLKKAGIKLPLRDGGTIDRKAAAKALMELESVDEKTLRRNAEKCVCVLHGDDSVVGQQAVFVGMGEVGGFDYTANIPREIEITLPAFVYDYLDQLYSINYIPIVDPVTDKEVIQKRRDKRFKLSLIERYIEGEDAE